MSEWVGRRNQAGLDLAGHGYCLRHPGWSPKRLGMASPLGPGIPRPRILPAPPSVPGCPRLQPSLCVPRALQGLQEAGALGEALGLVGQAARGLSAQPPRPHLFGFTFLTCSSKSAVSSAQKPSMAPQGLEPASSPGVSEAHGRTSEGAKRWAYAPVRGEFWSFIRFT